MRGASRRESTEAGILLPDETRANALFRPLRGRSRCRLRIQKQSPSDRARLPAHTWAHAAPTRRTRSERTHPELQRLGNTSGSITSLTILGYRYVSRFQSSRCGGRWKACIDMRSPEKRNCDQELLRESQTNSTVVFGSSFRVCPMVAAIGPPEVNDAVLVDGCAMARNQFTDFRLSIREQV